MQAEVKKEVEWIFKYLIIKNKMYVTINTFSLFPAFGWRTGFFLFRRGTFVGLLFFACERVLFFEFLLEF